MKNLFMAVALFAVGCGAPSSFEICLQTCDVLRKCGIQTDAMFQNCRTDCQNRQGALADQDAACERDCKNCGDRKAAFSSCLTQECNKIVPCTQAVDNTCVKK